MRGHDVEEDDDGSTDDSSGGAAAKSVGLATQHHHELDGFFSQRGACFFNTDVLLAQHAARATKLDISNSLIACFGATAGPLCASTRRIRCQIPFKI